MKSADRPKRRSFLWWTNRFMCFITGRCVIPSDEEYYDWLNYGKKIDCYYCGKKDILF